MEAGGDHEPSGRRPTTIPAPPAPPSGAIPLRMEVKIAKPSADASTEGGTLRSTLRLVDLSVCTTPLTAVSCLPELRSGPISTYQ